MSLSRRARLASRLVAAASCGRRGLCSPAALCPDRSPTPAKPWRGAWWLRGGAAVPYTLSCAGHAPAAAAVAAAAAGAPAPAPPRAPAPAPAPRAPARLLDGRAMAAAWTADVGAAVAAHARRRGAPRRPPGLAVLLVGDHPDSQLYVRRKREACEAAGISFSLVQLGNAAPQASVLRAVRAAVADPEVHGVLVQLPLPPHIDEEAVLEAVGTDKDVDGFHPVNAGRLSMRGRTPVFVPCTPKGCLEMLRRARIPVAGASCVVLGNSNVVGTPLSMLLRDCGASAVTVCHAAGGGGDEARLAALCRGADILFVAVGVPGLVRGSWVKPGAVVVDVGINAVPAAAPGGGGGGGGPHEPWRVVGDVAFDEVRAVAGALTPVPGGVGPMTVAALLDNTCHAWLRAELGHGYNSAGGGEGEGGDGGGGGGDALRLARMQLRREAGDGGLRERRRDEEPPAKEAYA